MLPSDPFPFIVTYSKVMASHSLGEMGSLWLLLCLILGPTALKQRLKLPHRHP